ncbi:MAG TPA: YggS family pyridoxal phosphate-dependent enzyme [Mesotoga sp.]|uniref:YggS family pyridoxal phosphate-dependent enzyme n=1 Tax=Mesotoga sp. TaxID=2053577 RepID=UPI001BD1C5B2|nr:YggS family pyridoxal phosphate-dependent enzyme [Mesotoga sp.]MDD3460392.1 YggS family pyridoxal phosphate-dependent enzyme [Mesotoga sp.]HNS34522.1 YggS family pyridoxal phosphate-dependent enzyme [Mesotoga sp.]HNU23285.1 YggS family pyridoxal phosphate-dependent enzyme [Mesotoga sp.]
MIVDNVKRLRREIPDYVTIVAASKTRTASEILELLDSGLRDVGENYVQEAQEKFEVIGSKARWHCIGHLQRNKVKKAVEIFDLIQTVDSLKLAEEIDKRCAFINRRMPIMIEVNSGREEKKAGVFPENVFELIESISSLENISVVGLMTMGPLTDDQEEIRPYLRLTRELFEEISMQKIERVQMRYLSMGMSGSYKVAIEEGSNMVRLGTIIFGERQ